MKRLSKQCANGRAPLPLRLWAHGVHERRPCIPAPLLSCPTQHCSWYALVCGRHPPAQLPRLGASTWKGKPMTWSPLTAAATRAKSPGRLFSRWWQLLLASCAHLEQLGEGRKRKCWIRSIRHKLEAQPCLPPHATVWNAQLKGHGCKKDRCGTTSQQLQTTGRHSKTIRL